MKLTYPLLAAVAALGLAGCATSSSVKLHPVENQVPPLAAGTYDFADLSFRPIAIKRVAPQYPLELRKAGATGHAVVVFIVGTDGAVYDLIIQNATDVAFADAAAASVQQWRFHPAQPDGRPVNCRMAVPIGFDLTEN